MPLMPPLPPLLLPLVAASRAGPCAAPSAAGTTAPSRNPNCCCVCRRRLLRQRRLLSAVWAPHAHAVEGYHYTYPARCRSRGAWLGQPKQKHYHPKEKKCDGGCCAAARRSPRSLSGLQQRCVVVICNCHRVQVQEGRVAGAVVPAASVACYWWQLLRSGFESPV